MIKKIVALVLFLVLGKMSYSQYPIVQNIGNDSAVVVSKGGLQGRLINWTYSDTATANTQRIRQYPGAQIATINGGLNLWVRNANATAWLPLALGSGNNIYTIDGTLLGNRELDGGGYSLRFNSLSEFGVGADSTVFVANKQRYFAGDSVLFNTPSFNVKDLFGNLNVEGTAASGSSSLTLKTDSDGSWSIKTGAVGFEIGDLRFYDNVNGGGTARAIIKANGNVGIGTELPDSMLTVTNGALFQRGVRMSGLPAAQGTKALRIDANGTISTADTLIDAGGTVTSIATNNGSGITGGTITTTGTLAIDTTNVIATKASVTGGLAGKLNISDTSSMLQNYVNNVGYGLGKSGQTVSADSATLSAYYLRRKDSLTATNSLGYVTKTILADTAAAIRGAAVTGFVPYTGATQNVNLGEYGIASGFLRLDTTPTGTPADKGTLYWEGNTSTVSLIMNGTIQRVGQSSYYYAKNETGTLIPKGTAVRFAGTDGGSGHLLIAPFLANGTYPSTYFMGITSEPIDNGGFGQVIAFGRLDGVNTNGFVDGDILYASTTVAGGFQTTVPQAPNNIVQISAVINASNNGKMLVRPTLGSNINNDEGVKITSPTSNSILVYNSTSGLWVDTTVAGAGIAVTSVATNTGTGITGGTITTTGTIAADTLLLSTRAWRQKGIDSVAALANSKINGSLLSGYLTKATGSLTIDTSQIYQNGQNVGIGTIVPDGRLAIVDTGGFALKIMYNSASTDANTNAALYAENNGLSSYVTIFNEKTTNNTGGQYPLLVESSLTSGTAQSGMATGIHFGVPDDAGNRKVTQLAIRTTNAAAATYTNRAELRLWNNGSSSTPYYFLGNGNMGLGTSTPDSNLTVVNGTLFQRGVRMSGLPAAAGTKSLRIDASGTLSYADTLIDAGGTVTSIATNTATGITGGTITTTGTLAIDTLLVSTRAWRQKGIDSVAALLPAAISGTTNYIPKFTSSSAIGNSLMQDNGTNVFIGTNASNSKFSIQGVGGATGVTLGLENGGGVVSLNDPIGIIDFYSNDPSVYSNGVFGRISVNNEFNGTWNGTQGRVVTYMAFSTTENASLSEKMRLRSNGVLSIGNTNGTGSVLDIKPSSTTSNGIILSTTYNGTGSYGPFIFETGGTERLRISSTGNVSIGNTNNSVKLDVSGDVRSTTKYAWGTATNGTTGQIATDNTNNYFDYLGALIFRTAAASSEKMRLDASGILGLGVTPSAWNSSTKALQIGARLALWDATNATILGYNVFNNTSAVNTYLQTANAMRYIQNDNGHIWQIAPSGTAVAAITFTQAMTLDASGRLGIGTTSPLYRLQVSGTSTSLIKMSNISANRGIIFGIDGSSEPSIQAVVDNTDVARQLSINPSGGNVGIGTTSPSTLLEVAGVIRGASLNVYGSTDPASTSPYLYSPSTGALGIGANGSERMRITSGGNVGIGSTSPTAKLHVFGTSGATTILAEGATNASAYGKLEMRGRPAGAGQSAGWLVVSSTEGGQAATNVAGIDFTMANASGNAHNMLFSTHNGTSLAERMRITSGGEVLVNTTTDAGAYYLQVNGDVYAGAYYESSDRRLKDILSVREGSHGINTVTFKWKDQRDSLSHVGYIAQDVEKVLPGAVKTNPDGFKTVNYDEVQTFKIAALEKEIAELKEMLKKIIDKK